MPQDTSGIMGLQEDYLSQGKLPPHMGVEVADGALQQLSPEAPKAMDEVMSKASEGLSKLTDDQLDIFIQLVQQLFDEPENYAENRANLIKNGGLTEEDVPPTYDPASLSMMLYVLRKEQMSRKKGMSPDEGSVPPMAGAAPQMMPPPPQQLARGGIAEAARIVAGSGRNGDTMLAHITPREAKLLRKHGGSGTINPKTGLPEYAWYSFIVDAWHSVWRGVVKPFLQSSIGKIITTVALNVLLPGWGQVINSGLQAAANGGNFGDIVKSMAISTAVSFVSGSIPGVESPIKGVTDSLAGNLGITSEVGKQALLSGIVNTGAGLLQGQGLKDSMTSGLMAAGMVHASQAYSDYKGAQAGAPEPGKVPIEERYPNGTSVTTQPTGPLTPLQAEGKDVTTPMPDYASLPKVAPPSTSSPVANTTSSTVGQPQVNAGTSTNVQTGATPGSSTAAPYKPVSVGDAFSTMGEGAKQILTGDVSKGFDTLGTGAKDLFMPSSPTADQLAMRQGELMKSNPNLTPTQAMDLAKGEAPGILRTYGPAAAAGLGIMAMAGGFSPQQNPNYNPNGPQFKGPTGEDLLKADPKKYLVQGMPGVQYDAAGNIIGHNDAYPYATMNDVRVASNYGTQARYADGGEVMPDYLAEGGVPGMSPGMQQNLANFYLRFRGRPIPGLPRTTEVGVPNIGQSGITMGGGLAGVAAKMKAQRDAEAAAAAQAAATAAANAPGQANKLYAANPDQYRPNMQQPQYMATGGPANGAGRAGFSFDPNDPQIVEYRNMAQSLTPAARQYLAAHNNNGAIADMNMMREAMAYSAKEAARRAPAQENALYAANPQQYQPNMTRPSGIAGLAMGGYPRKTGQISGPGTETSDSVPAMLSDGEFVMTARAVRGLGKGDRREGAKKMYALMHQLERNAARG